MNVLWAFAPALQVSVAFAVFAAVGGELTADIALPALHLFGIVRYAVGSVPSVRLLALFP